MRIWVKKEIKKQVFYSLANMGSLKCKITALLPLQLWKKLFSIYTLEILGIKSNTVSPDYL